MYNAGKSETLAALRTGVVKWCLASGVLRPTFATVDAAALQQSNMLYRSVLHTQSFASLSRNSLLEYSVFATVDAAALQQ